MCVARNYQNKHITTAETAYVRQGEYGLDSESVSGYELRIRIKV